MVYHIFNPDHEIALAADARNIMPSRKVRQMCHDLDYIPALWAEDGDVVIAEDVQRANQLYALSPLEKRCSVTFLTMEEAAQEINELDTIRPWGWNKALREKFLKAGTTKEVLPDDAELEMIRQLSNRSLAVDTLENIVSDGRECIGASHVCHTQEEVQEYLERYGGVVLKAPWSCSGRGVRFIRELDDPTIRWVQKVISQQGSIIAEEEYDKIIDFAAEFEFDGGGKLLEKGMSLFSTSGSAYTGNMLMSIDAIFCVLKEYISCDALLLAILLNREQLIKNMAGRYRGPLGVDMMLVRTKEGKVKIHPCVEINVRMTMGHVACELSQRGQRGIMRTTFEDRNFKLILENTIKQLFK